MYICCTENILFFTLADNGNLMVSKTIPVGSAFLGKCKVMPTEGWELVTVFRLNCSFAKNAVSPNAHFEFRQEVKSDVPRAKSNGEHQIALFRNVS